jgi:hypothetical protein
MLQDNDPKQIATQQFQEIFVTFFMEHIMAYLNDALVSKQETSLEKYKHVMMHHCEKLHLSKPHYLITKTQKTIHIQLLKG